VDQQLQGGHTSTEDGLRPVGWQLQRFDPETYPEGSQLVVGEQHEKLPTIVHWFEDNGPPKVNERMCTDPQRQRCLSGRGGYQFRWYSALWYGWISSAPAVPGLEKCDVRRRHCKNHHQSCGWTLKLDITHWIPHCVAS
jgi:hypothetical protein